jgi:hypothetical protein
LIRADRVKESSTSTSTSAFLLNGADSTYRTFASVCAVGDTVYYAIAHRSANEWEVGLGTYSATNTLTRTTVHASSNANAAVAFSSGTKDVLLALTKAQLETYATLAGTETLTNKTISGANNTITNVSLTSGVTGTLPLANGGTGTTTAQLAINALAGAVTSGSYLRGNGTNVVMATISAGDVPTLNQNTTGTASGSVSGTASYLAKFTNTNVVGNSLIYDSGTNVGIGTTSPSDRLHVYKSGDATAKIEGTTSASLNFTKNAVYCGYIGAGSSGNNDIYIYNLASGAVRINNRAVYVTATNLVGVNEQSPGAQLQVTTAAAATKGLIVKGASGQSANLQEWQNSAGTVLAAVSSAGTLMPYGGIYTNVVNGFVSELYINQQVSEYTQSFYRTLPSVVGDYVEFIEVNDTTSTRYEFSISVVNYPYWLLKRYEFTTTWNNATNGVVPPVSISNRNNALDFDYELETVSVGSYYRRFRIKRTKGTTANVQAMVLMRSFGDFATHSRTELTGTGTSTYSSYITRSYDYVNPNIAAPPPANYSGSGTPLSLYASNAIGTGAGGGLTLQAGNAASTGGGGSITLYTGAGAGGGVGGAILSRSQADSYNRSSKFILVRSIPDTVGNYVELGRIGWLAGAILKVSVFASRGAYDATLATYNALGKEYEIYTHYSSSGTVAPRTVSGGSQGGRQPNEFELELAWNANGYQVLRLRRSKADATNFSGYTATVVIEQLIWSPHAFEFVELSGTGTSALTNAYLTNTGTYCYPALIPPPTVGTSGAGTDLAIYGGSAIGTGAGGSILLQAGAFSTSGSNGKVIVRGLASNTANLQEWQNNAGTALASISPAGAGVVTSTLNINNATRSGESVTLTSSSVVSSATTDLTIGGTGASIYRMYISTSDGVLFSNWLGTDTGQYPRFNGSGLRLGAGSIGFRQNATWQGSDDVGLTWGGVGTMRVSNASSGGGSFAFTSNTPSAFTADQNNLALSASGFQRLSGTAARNITGIAPPSGSHVDGRMIRIYNVGTFNLTLKHNNANSTAANRFWNVQAIDIIVGANDYAELIYDGTNNGSGAAGWRVA